MMSWFSGGRSLKKSQYYVWYLGSKEADGLRGAEHVMPVMRQMLKESLRRFPNKITVQVSQKGLKLIQTVPTMNKSGKLKTEIIKFHIAAQSITFSMVGPPPFTDIVGCIVLVFNPETKSPVHVHCYRCDSPETATFMNANLQALLNRPESQKRLLELERRLTMTGLLSAPTEVFRGAASTAPMGYAARAMPPSMYLQNGRAAPSTSAHPQVQRRASYGMPGFDGRVGDLAHTHRYPGGAAGVSVSSTQQQHGRNAMASSNDFDYALASDDSEDNEQFSNGWPASTAQRKERLKKDLFYELRDRLNVNPRSPERPPHRPNPSAGQRPLRSRAKSSTPEYYPKSSENGDNQQASPTGAKDSSSTSTTSGLGSDFSSGRGASEGVPTTSVSNGGPMFVDRRRFSVVDLHRAWRVEGDQLDHGHIPQPMRMTSSPKMTPPVVVHRRKQRYQKAHEQQEQHRLLLSPSNGAASMELRMFGDTLLKPNQHQNFVVANHPQQQQQEFVNGGRRQWKSVDNLHHRQLLQPPKYDEHRVVAARRGFAAAGAFDDAAAIAATGSEHDRFWKERAQRRSLFLPDDTPLFP